MIESFNSKGKALTLGILGGGQLAKMLASAAYRMGINVAVIEKGEASPAGDMTRLEYTRGWLDSGDLADFINVSDIVTLENEFIDPSILESIEKQKAVFPASLTMKLVQDKFIQKQTFENAGLPVPVFAELNSTDDLLNFSQEHTYPYVIKARKFGYDGYGNATVFREEEAIEAWERFNGNEIKRPLMAEKFVDFSKELAVLVARNQRNETAVYPCVETVQYRHICHEVIAPAEISENTRRKAQEIARAAVESIDGIGVFGVEMFLARSGELLINEIAPRPHNSGHYTIEACYTSQFENCIRAVLNLPLGSPKMVTPAAAMVNLLGGKNGSGIPDNVIDLLRHDKVSLHLYNKKQCRIGRKMGHITALGSNQQEALNRAKSAADAIIW